MAKTQMLLIEFGDGAPSDEEFAFNCSINTSQEFSIEATSVEAVEPNCVVPVGPSWVARVVDTLSAGISGEGTMDPLSWGAMRDFMLAGEAINMRVTLDIPGAQGGGYFAGPFIMTNLGAAKEGRNGFVSSSVELQSAGAIAWMDAA